MFATLSPTDHEVINGGDEDSFILYILAHAVLGTMFTYHRRLGSYFEPEAIKAIRIENSLDIQTMQLVMGAMQELGYIRPAPKFENGRATLRIAMTIKGMTNSAIWAHMGDDLAFEMVYQWRTRWGHNCNVCATKPGYRFCPNCLGGKKVA
jgi:hypothetical protein